jgi:hypothetical protein
MTNAEQIKLNTAIGNFNNAISCLRCCVDFVEKDDVKEDINNYIECLENEFENLTDMLRVF